MKGLILTHMGKREEGLELVKKGVRLDLTSHIVWHVFGLIQKGEKNYEEALKSYTQALRFDKVSRNRALANDGVARAPTSRVSVLGSVAPASDASNLLVRAGNHTVFSLSRLLPRRLRSKI
jgi:tetratricopeptide (TPR) repeat protein